MLSINLNSRMINPAPDAPADVVTVKPVSVAFLLGASDAEAGGLCIAELYFVRREQVLRYVEGFEAVTGETLLSKQTKVLYGVTN